MKLITGDNRDICQRRDFHHFHFIKVSLRCRLIMKINKEWHLSNKMPEKPSLDQRIEWHLAHSKNCSCRELGGKILEEIKKRNLI